MKQISNLSCKKIQSILDQESITYMSTTYGFLFYKTGRICIFLKIGLIEKVTLEWETWGDAYQTMAAVETAHKILEFIAASWQRQSGQ